MNNNKNVKKKKILNAPYQKTIKSKTTPNLKNKKIKKYKK